MSQIHRIQRDFMHPYRFSEVELEVLLIRGRRSDLSVYASGNGPSSISEHGSHVT